MYRSVKTIAAVMYPFAVSNIEFVAFEKEYVDKLPVTEFIKKF
jgi:hypothetical protein